MKHTYTLTGIESNSNGSVGQFKVSTCAVSLPEICTISKVPGPRRFLFPFYSLLPV